MKRIHIVGRKNSGKTTLIVELVPELASRGYQVGTIKHTHHRHELDTPGKDSFRHRAAGSVAVGILTPETNAVFWPQPKESTSDDKYASFAGAMAACDLVLVEGDSEAIGPKVEVYRSEVDGKSSDAPLASSDPSIQAVITNDELQVDMPVWSRQDLSSIANNIETMLDLNPPNA